MNKEIEMLNNDKVTLDYALLVLTKVFGFDKQGAYKVATQIDRDGSAVVFTGTENDAEDKMQQLNDYNAATNNDLKAKLQDAGTYQAPSQDMTLSNYAVTLQLNSFVPPDEQFGYAIQSLRALDKGLNKTINWNWFVSDLQNGKEVVIKEFEGDRAEQKAKMFLDALTHLWEMDKPESEMSDEEKRDNANLSLSVRAPSYALSGAKTLISAEEMEKAERGAALADVATSVYDDFIRRVINYYGSVEAYLEQASDEERKDYQELQEQMKEVEGLKDKALPLSSASLAKDDVSVSTQNPKPKTSSM